VRFTFDGAVQPIIMVKEETRSMAKQLILYNLKDGIREEDFVKWVRDYKGPLIAGLSSVNRYTLTWVQGAVKADGGPPGAVETPYRLAGIVDVTSLEAYAKDQETPIYKDEFMPRFKEWVKNFLILKAEVFFDQAG
jgi:hypothetical protein